MYFKSIELKGFKSFVDETKMVFEPGVTAIVGPNGCGKSNIADALRWVLGEQSAKSMRGTKMEDFIFNGSANRKPTGYAEVSLTMANPNGVISTQPYSEYEEITVTRKYYRNGDSDYFINSVPCRLKDIVDIFLDTGINARALSIIEQGQVTRIVNSKPDDRKVFIDEAAGIMKYKVRRNAAMNKLENSQQNLLRVQDILGELERQRNSLNRQAKKAERYRAFRDEIKGCALAHFAIESRRHREKLDELDTALTGLREREAALQADLSAKRNSLETLKIKISEEEKALSELKEERGRLQAARDRNDDNREFLIKHIGELDESRDTARADIGQVEEEIARNEEQIAERTAELDESRIRLETLEDELAGLKEEAAEARMKLDQAQEEFEDAASGAVRSMEQASARRNQQSSIRTKLEMSESRLAEIIEREGRLSGETEALRSRREELDRELGEAETAFAGKRSVVEDVARRLETAGAELNTAGQEHRAVADEITKNESRLESLQELERNLEGYGEGVRKLMKLKEEGREEARGLGGPVAQGISAGPDMETALTAALGTKLEAVVVDNTENLSRAVGLLKQDKLGGASFVAQDMSKTGHPAPAAPSHPGLLGRASEIFRIDQGVPRAVAGLMERMFVAADLQSAVEIWKLNPGACAVVTKEGEVIDAEGFVTGGVGGGASGIVSRKRVIEELSATLEGLRETERAAAERLETLTREKEGLSAGLAEAEAEARRLELSIVGLKNDVREAQSGEARHAEALDAIAREKEQIDNNRRKLNEELEVIDTEMAELDRGRQEAETARERAQEEIRRRKDAHNEATEKLQAKELELTGLRGKLEGLTVDIRRLESIKSGAVARLQRLKDSIRDYSAKKEEMENSIESLVSENVELARKADELSGRIGQMSDVLGEKTEQAAELQKAISGLQGELDTTQPQVSETALKKSEAQMRLDNTIEKADAEFSIPVEDMENADTGELDPEEVSNRLNYLRGELSRIGDVNLSALEEFEQVNSRFEFLKSQRDDLVSSIATLHKTIDSINATTSKKFMETFESVSANFEKIFKRLFNGGRAEMKLVHEEGKTEPGVEIMVQPPGKKNQSLALLSAGEKAMTAIALLFSVFLHRPSPFCLLDEIDAPLDEANIGRFRDLMVELQEHTQFVVITHSQKTMSFADRLYGVTQEEEGVSKILAVNLKDDRAPIPIAAA